LGGGVNSKQREEISATTIEITKSGSVSNELERRRGKLGGRPADRQKNKPDGKLCREGR